MKLEHLKTKTNLKDEKSEAAKKKAMLGLVRIYEKTSTQTTGGLLFIIRVNREVKRVYINGCRYNERLNSETEGSKTSYIHCQST